MSGLETLPPDQRAVLQLILVQGRGYADLAALLKLDPDAVRSRAVAGVEALGAPGADALDAAQRARVADYLLGQQDDGERIVTFAELGESAAACRWAQALRERLAGVARTELPAVPAAAAANGNHAAVATPAPAVGSPAPAPAAAVARSAETTPAASPAQPPSSAASADSPRASRLGGAVLIAGGVALAVVLAIVLIGGGDDDGGSSASGSAAAGATQTQTQAETQPSASTQPSTTPAATPRIVAQANLTATPAGGEAIGIGLVQRSGRRLGIAIEAQRLPANGAQDIYAVWLQGAAGSRFLGFVPRQVRANGRFTVSAALPGNARELATVLITREGTTAVPQTPGQAILSGPLTFR